MAILNPFAEDFPHENPSVFRVGVFPAIFDDTVQTQVQPSKLKTCCARSWLSSHDGKSTENTFKKKIEPKIRLKKSFTVFATSDNFSWMS